MAPDAIPFREEAYALAGTLRGIMRCIGVGMQGAGGMRRLANDIHA